MKITRIGELFSLARGGEGTKNEAHTKQVQSQGSKQNPEAIRLAKDFGSGTSAVQEAQHQKRLEELKKQISEKTYNPDPHKVATAIAQDLFA